MLNPRYFFRNRITRNDARNFVVTDQASEDQLFVGTLFTFWRRNYFF